ncbi:MAG: siphovirus Gp157 family protein [Terriglobia bacterium]|nr:siphovirus Gp157 family protein [Terriglobia bacterium]
MAILEPFVLPSPETSLTNSPVTGKSTAPRPKKTSPAQEIASTHSIFEIDQEIDAMIEAHQQEFEANGLISAESMLRFEQFLHAMNAKVDRIGGYIRATENIANCSKLEADRLSKRAKAATNKADRVKSMLLYYMKTREQQSLEGTLFTARICKNAADTVTVTDKDAIPAAYRRHDARIDGGAWESILALLPRELQIVLESSAKDFSVNSEAIKAAKTQGTEVPGAEVKRGDHLRIG